MNVALVLAVAAAVAAAFSTAFTGLSLRFLAKQTAVLAEQARLQSKQTELMYAATELTFNLEVMVRLQEVLRRVAEDADTRSVVWGEAPGNDRQEVEAEALLDVLAMALKACKRLPGFASNEDDWTDYAAFVMEGSAHLRDRVLGQPKWWPEITEFAERAAAATKEH